ncbi:glycerol kinase-like [Raphidocelis subcapitata]|uniref:glycerol kinase n=1 Tax=Raphidocelis subcapitata TaxID=307507 RepID=A0A2V0PHT2_9CHLO|nr:glycerol kinase-like [Raphidocelis subcapitata]|eukprot:GBF97483.1 glycerol kinase-like [Raphidocelis subcapitata]
MSAAPAAAAAAPAGAAMEVAAAIDQGTQSTRVFLFDRAGGVVASHQVPLRQIYPKAGWCEHDPMLIWGTVEACIEGALASAREKLGQDVQVKALGITNQRETTVLWSRSTGEPLHNAIVWLDNRTSEVCARLQESLPGGKDHFRPVTGLPISTYFSAYKVQWLLENCDKVRAAVDSGDALFGTVDSWLIWQLTGGARGGVHVTDASNASRTNMLDLRTRQWHAPFVELFGLNLGVMPRVASNAEVLGHVKEGPLAGVPISGCLGDQQAALVGQRCGRGEAKNTYGTGCFMLLNTGSELVPSTHGLLTTFGYQLGPKAAPHYALEGSIAVAGLGISWLKDNLRLIDSADESEALAASVPDTGGVYFVPAFSGLLAPHWIEDARGVLLGMTGFTTRAHVVRAMLEAICFQTREVLDAMRADADMSHMAVLRVDGGAAKNDLLMQLQSDLLHVPVSRPLFQETTALGAALAAGLAVGFYPHDFVTTHPENHSTLFRPAVSLDNSEKRYAHWRKAVSRSLALAELADQ